MTDRNAKPPPLHGLPALLRGAEVAAVLRARDAHVRGLARAGRLPAARIGGSRSEWLYDKRRVLAVIEGGDPWADFPPLLEDQPDVLTAGEVAWFFRLSRPFVLELANEGHVRGFRVGGPGSEWRFDRRHIAFLALPTNRRPVQPDPDQAPSN